MQSLGGMVAHAGLIASGGLRLLGAAALPIGGLDPWVGVGVLSVVLAGAAALRRVLAQGDRLRADLGRWLAIAGAGALVALASWSVYVPAADHYVPSPAGTVNRMNAAAAVGLVVVVYSAAVLLVRTLGRLVRLPAGAASLGVVISSLLLGGAYLGRTAVDARAWDAAAADQRRELAELHAALPRLAAGVTVYAFDAPRVVGPGVPVLDTSLDLTSAMDISYSSPGLVGVPIAGPASLTCAPRESLASGVASAYGRSYMLDVAARRVTRLGNPLQCAAARGGPIGAAAGRRR
jgi:hypothetical protein